MDGHEQEDVVKYQNEVFLPAIAQFETWMAKLEGPELKNIMLELVICTGNPRVFSSIPIPVPANYPHPFHGYG